MSWLAGAALLLALRSQRGRLHTQSQKEEKEGGVEYNSRQNCREEGRVEGTQQRQHGTGCCVQVGMATIAAAGGLNRRPYEKLTNTLWMERCCMPLRQVGHFFCARTASTRQS